MMGPVHNSPRVLVVGDANVDLVVRGDVRPRWGQAEQLVEAADLTLGGSGALVAHGLARLGVSVTLCAAVGRDAFGDFTVDALERAGVDVGDVVRRDAGPTGLSVILSDASDGGDRAILTHLGVIDSLVRAELPDLSGFEHLHVASPYLTGQLRPDLPALLWDAKAAGLSTTLDTNDDPAREWVGLRDLLCAADTVLPNRGEIVLWAAVLGLAPTDWLEAQRSIAQLGPAVVAKAGAEGGVWTMGGAILEAPAPSLVPVDTTGAGDSFDAGWIAGCLADAEPAEALRWAVHAGSLSTRAAGGAPAQPTREELLASLAEAP
jgi:sugar/nucleoside kinase (ribokinase family)